MIRAVPFALMAAFIVAGSIMAMRDGDVPKKASAAAVKPLAAVSRDDLARQASLTPRHGPYAIRWCASATRDVCH